MRQGAEGGVAMGNEIGSAVSNPERQEAEFLMAPTEQISELCINRFNDHDRPIVFQMIILIE